MIFILKQKAEYDGKHSPPAKENDHLEVRN